MPEPNRDADFNVLLVHKMIVSESPLWPGQKDFSYASPFLKKNEFDLIVSGDNHAHFHAEQDGRHLVNCGALMRSTVADRDHEPVCYLFDTETRELELVKVPVEPIGKVMDLKKASKEAEVSESLRAFVAGLEEQKDLGLNFLENLRVSLADAPEEVRAVVEEVLSEC